MSAATDALENDLVSLIFVNENSTLDIGDTGGLQGSTAPGNLYVALHTAAPDSPGEAPASQSVNEATYTGYSRQAVIRQTSGSPNGGWTISGSTASNAAEIAFGQCSAGSETLTHYSIGVGAGATDVLFFGTLTSSLAVSAGIEPRFAIGQLAISVD